MKQTRYTSTPPGELIIELHRNVHADVSIERARQLTKLAYEFMHDLATLAKDSGVAEAFEGIEGDKPAAVESGNAIDDLIGDRAKAKVNGEPVGATS